jgi:hypothetical protein
MQKDKKDFEKTQPMTSKEILEDLTCYDSIKHLRKSLLQLILEFMANDEIDDRSDAYATYIVLDNHLWQIGKYQKRKSKKKAS